MRPSVPFSSTITDHLIRSGTPSAEFAMSLAHEVLADRLPNDLSDLLDSQDQERANVYFYLYGLPVIESAGLTEPRAREEALLWARVQTCLGMHLRYADDILDGDAPPDRLALIYRRSRAYLAQAQRLLHEAKHPWGPAQEAIFVQFIAYEMELAGSLSPHFETQWRRVSPLCVLTRTYLAERTEPGFAAEFDRYLAWSLGHADRRDLLEDLNRSRVTPLTRLAHEVAGSTTDLGLPAVSKAHSEAKQFLARSTPTAGQNAPLWQSLIAFLELAYGPDSEAVDP